MQQQQDRHGSCDAKGEQRVFCGVELSGLSDHLRVVAQREVDTLEPLLDVVNHLVQRAARHVGADIDAPRLIRALDGVRRGPHRDVGDVGQLDPAARRRVQLHVFHVGDAVACGRDRRDMDVVRPAAGEDVADLLAGDHGRGLPPDLSRGQADGSSFGHICFDLNMRQVGLQ